jgi:hypothetical protein
MPTFYYSPQNAWGLVDGEHWANLGFYSQPGGSCRPVALWCQDTQRAAYTHYDGGANGALTTEIADWLVDDNKGYNIQISTEDIQDYNSIIAKLHGYQTAFIKNENIGTWHCRFTQEGAQWLEQGEPEQRTPVSWSEYWNGAPEWVTSGTFSNAIVDQLVGFIANYNGHFYFDFPES